MNDRESGRTETASSQPLVYACAGCSWVARLAYDLARELDRRGDAEMSCLAGVGARRPKFLNQLQGRETWVIDGCPIECGQGVFEANGLAPMRHVRLHALGYRKARAPAAGVDVARLAASIEAQLRAEATNDLEEDEAWAP
jgi:uncharacterized metal-binding protein